MPRTAMPAARPAPAPAASAPAPAQMQSGGDEWWECAWCTDFAPVENRQEGPDGARTLCVACGSSFLGGSGEAGQTERAGASPHEDSHGRAIDTIIGKSGLRLQPALEPEPEPEPDEAWECSWCTEWEEAEDRRSGPDGPCTLCRTCAAELDAPEMDDAVQLSLEAATSLVAPDVDAIVARVSREVGDRVAERQQQAETARHGDSDSRNGSTKSKPKRRSASPRSPARAQSQPRRREGAPSEGVWRCEWCESGDSDTEEHHEGPSGPGRLCDTCAYAYQGNRARRPSLCLRPWQHRAPAQQPEMMAARAKQLQRFHQNPVPTRTHQRSRRGHGPGRLQRSTARRLQLPQLQRSGRRKRRPQTVR